MTATVTADFREEYEAERTRWLRRRFLWYSGVVIAISALAYLVLIGVGVLAQTGVLAQEAARGMPSQYITNAITLPSLVYYIWAFMHVRRRALVRDRLLSLVNRLIVVAGALGIIAAVVGLESMRFFNPEVYARLGGFGHSPLIGANGAWGIFISHFFASCFLPWTPRESLRPIIPLMVLNAAVTTIYGWAEPISATLTIILSPLVALPGCLICLWRASRHRDRFTYKMLKGRYSEIKRELGMAREIHEGLFPDPVREGPIRFEYVYEPMRQIGGDYLYARTLGDGSMHVVIVDVTGHGISAALTVNRLHGELDRLLAEHPEAGPSMILTGLNQYMHHTVSGFSVYATVLCMKVHPDRQEVRWSSAGHPPAFLRGVDGTIHHIDSTSIVLGACRGEDFEAEERSAQFGPGDAIIAYTDGAIESRNRDGKLLSIRGFERMLAAGVPDERTGWAGRLLREVDQYRHGPVEDDVLIVELFRPLDAVSATGAAQPAARARSEAATAETGA